MYVHISEGALEAWVCRESRSKDDLWLKDDETLVGWLKKIRGFGILHGLDHDRIKGLHSGLEDWTDPILIAKGEAAVDETSILEFKVPLMKKPEPQDQNVDFRCLGFGVDVQRGQLLAELLLEGPGADGKEVTGKVLPHQKNIRDAAPSIKGAVEVVKEEGRVKYFSRIDGFLWNHRRDELNVQPGLVWNGAVDFRVGDIKSIHPIEIQGDVKPGFTVQSQGDIIVHGALEGGATCESGRDLKVQGGVSKGANLLAGRHIELRFAQGAKLRCGADLRSSHYLYDVELRAEGRLISEGRGVPGRGAVIGGVLNAISGMDLASAGSPNAPTTLAVGVDLEVERELKELRDNLPIKKMELGRLARKLPLNWMDPEFKEKVQSLPDAERVQVRRLLGMILELKHELEGMGARLDYLERESEKVPQDAQILIRSDLVPDLLLRVGEGETVISEPMPASRFAEAAGKISSEGL